MNFRYARHTNQLNKIETFYTEIVGLEKLGSFKNHETYNGIFLGFPNQDWHLEFTMSDDKPQRKFDEDDILVFYLNSDYEVNEIKNRLTKNHIRIEKSKNPYWNENGIQISDPDGYKIIFTLKNSPLTSDDNLTKEATQRNITLWNDLVKMVKNLPYGRNENRFDFSLVLKENKGTCSSKHALLSKIAELNGVKNVKLILGIFRMNSQNNPKIKQILQREDLEYIPEAHCYLCVNNLKLDVTHTNSSFSDIENDILEEIEIKPEQVNEYKIDYHKKFLKNWLENENSSRLTFAELWEIREECIKQLEE